MLDLQKFVGKRNGTDFAQNQGDGALRCTMHRGGLRMFERAMVGENQPPRHRAGAF